MNKNSKIGEDESSKTPFLCKDQNRSSSIFQSTTNTNSESKEGINEPYVFQDQKEKFFYKNGDLLCSFSKTKYRCLSEHISKYSVEGRMKHMPENYWPFMNELIEGKTKKKRVAIIRMIGCSRIGIFYASMKKNFKAKKKCKKALRLYKKLEEEDKGLDEIQRHLMRLYIVLGDVLVRNQKSKGDVKQALDYLDKADELLEKFDPKEDDVKTQWKERNIAWCLMNRGKALFKQSSNEEQISKIEEIFNKALEIIRKGTPNKWLTNKCLKEMKKLSLKIKDEDIVEKEVCDYQEPNDEKERMKYLKNLESILKDIENSDDDFNESSLNTVETCENNNPSSLMNQNKSLNSSNILNSRANEHANQSFSSSNYYPLNETKRSVWADNNTV